MIKTELAAKSSKDAFWGQKERVETQRRGRNAPAVDKRMIGTDSPSLKENDTDPATTSTPKGPRKHFWMSQRVDERFKDEIVKYSTANHYVASMFAQAVCLCGSRAFLILLDDDCGCAARTCGSCERQSAIGDGEEYLDDAEDLDECQCPCGESLFSVACGVTLYEGSNDAKWFYLCLRCEACQLTRVYGDWKCEAGDASALLSKT